MQHRTRLRVPSEMQIPTQGPSALTAAAAVPVQDSRSVRTPAPLCCRLRRRVTLVPSIRGGRSSWGERVRGNRLLLGPHRNVKLLL